MGKPTKRDEFSLQSIVSYDPFVKWGLDFVGPTNPPSNQKSYILVCIDYLTKWTEVKALRVVNETTTLNF